MNLVLEKCIRQHIEKDAPFITLSRKEEKDGIPNYQNYHVKVGGQALTFIVTSNEKNLRITLGTEVREFGNPKEAIAEYEKVILANEPIPERKPFCPTLKELYPGIKEQIDAVMLALIKEQVKTFFSVQKNHVGNLALIDGEILLFAEKGEFPLTYAYLSDKKALQLGLPHVSLLLPLAAGKIERNGLFTKILDFQNNSQNLMSEIHFQNTWVKGYLMQKGYETTHDPFESVMMHKNGVSLPISWDPVKREYCTYVLHEPQQRLREEITPLLKGLDGMRMSKGTLEETKVDQEVETEVDLL